MEIRSLNQEVGRRIKDARKRRKVTQRDLAFQLDISYQMLQKHERGITPLSVDRLLHISQVLGCPVSELFPELLDNRRYQELVSHGLEERELVDAYRQLPSNSLRLRILELIREFLVQLDLRVSG